MGLDNLLMFPVWRTFRSKKYRAFIEQHRCLLCNIPPEVAAIHAHHEPLGLNMMGGKCPDSHCVPLCDQCHIGLRHGLGWLNWENEGIDIKQEIIKLLTEYLQQHDDLLISEGD